MVDKHINITHTSLKSLDHQELTFTKILGHQMKGFKSYHLYYERFSFILISA